MTSSSKLPTDGPYYDDLSTGQEFRTVSGITIDPGLAAQYVAISGDTLALSSDAVLSRRVTGRPERLANPTLVLHLAVGASTLATKRVIANLFYRNVIVRRPVFVGETLRTTTTVLGMADASPKPGTAPRGKLLLGMRTLSLGSESEQDQLIIDAERCPLLPCRGDTLPGHHDDLGRADELNDLDPFMAGIDPAWDLSPLGSHDAWSIGEQRDDPLRDVVDQATSLVRLTNNVAAAHRDVERSTYDRRLVYGGHTVALGAASLARVLGGLATIVGWQRCDHLGPVFEGDLLSFRHTVLRQIEVPNGWCRAIQVEVYAAGNDPVKVLDWVAICHTT